MSHDAAFGARENRPFVVAQRLTFAIEVQTVCIPRQVSINHARNSLYQSLAASLKGIPWIKHKLSLTASEDFIRIRVACFGDMRRDIF